MDSKKIIELLLALLITILIVGLRPSHKLNDFLVELLSEKPYIFLLYLSIFGIALYSPLIAMLYGILVLVLDNNIDIVCKKE